MLKFMTSSNIIFDILERKNGITLKLCQLIKYSKRNIFIYLKKSCRKCAPKATPDPFLILLNNPKQLLYVRNSFKDKIV